MRKDTLNRELIIVAIQIIAYLCLFALLAWSVR